MKTSFQGTKIPTAKNAKRSPRSRESAHRRHSARSYNSRRTYASRRTRGRRQKPMESSDMPYPKATKRPRPPSRKMSSNPKQPKSLKYPLNCKNTRKCQAKSSPRTTTNYRLLRKEARQFKRKITLPLTVTRLFSEISAHARTL